jgi:hypothetical protein
MAAVTLAGAQDIAGIEDCTKTAGLDKRTSCLQSNVNFLQQLVMKNALDERQRLNAANTEITALKAAVASLQARIAQLEAQAKKDSKPDAKSESKPDAKKP